MKYNLEAVIEYVYNFSKLNLLEADVLMANSIIFYLILFMILVIHFLSLYKQPLGYLYYLFVPKAKSDAIWCLWSF